MTDPKPPGDKQPPAPPHQVNPEGATVIVPLKDLAKPDAAAPPIDEEGATSTIDLRQVMGGDLAKIKAEILAQLNRKPEETPAAPPSTPAAVEKPALEERKTEPAAPRADSEPTAEVPRPVTLGSETVVTPRDERAVPEPPVPRGTIGSETVVTPPVPTAPPVTPPAEPPLRPVTIGSETVVTPRDEREEHPVPPGTIGSETVVAPPVERAAPEPPQRKATIGSETMLAPPLEKEVPPAKAAAPRVDTDATVVAPPMPAQKAPAPKKPEPSATSAAKAAPAAAPKPPAAQAAKPEPPAAPPPKPAPAQAAPPPPPPKPAPAPPPKPVAEAAPPASPRRSARSRRTRMIAVATGFGTVLLALVIIFFMKDYRLSETPMSASSTVAPAVGVATEAPVAAPAATDLSQTDSAAVDTAAAETPPAPATPVEKRVNEMLTGVTSVSAPPPRIAPPPVIPEARPKPKPRAERPSEPVKETPRAAAEPAVEHAPQEIPPPPAVPREGELVSLSDPGVTPPQIQSEEQPKYPRRAKMAGAKGTVTIRILVDQNGRAAEATIAKSSGNSLLDNAALLAARRTVWTPATVQGVRVRVWISREYAFTG